jgi:hypothetical protein
MDEAERVLLRALIRYQKMKEANETTEEKEAEEIQASSGETSQQDQEQGNETIS